MPNLIVEFSPDSELDLTDIYNYIAFQCKEPETAANYYGGRLEAIRKLSMYGDSIGVNPREFLQARYGPKARTIIYKKISIVFNGIDDTIYIRRIIPGNLIL